MTHTPLVREKEPLGIPGVLPFASELERNHLYLNRGRTSTLQVNVGLVCNQKCRHCHLDAGPEKREIMTGKTMAEVVEFASKGEYECIDITGGAPEMVPDVHSFMKSLAGCSPRVLLRSNLTAITGKSRKNLIDLCAGLGVVLVASFPSTNERQADSQRGAGVWQTSIDTLKVFNAKGYGQPGSGLELNLVSNPAGAFMPADQCRLEGKFRSDLHRRWGIVFNNLYSFANVPLGRYRRWLLDSHNYIPYIQKLADSFNPDTIPGVMCRSLISVSWEGYLYDCDFNLAADLPYGGRKIHLSEVGQRIPEGPAIAVGDHCYACTAGSGFT